MELDDIICRHIIITVDRRQTLSLILIKFIDGDQGNLIDGLAVKIIVSSVNHTDIFLPVALPLSKFPQTSNYNCRGVLGPDLCNFFYGPVDYGFG